MKSEVDKTTSQSSLFVSMALDMSWRLAIAVLAPILIGVFLDNQFNSSTFIIIGFVLAMIGTGYIFWQTLQAANQIPVPKLTAAEKRAIKRRDTEDDE